MKLLKIFIAALIMVGCNSSKSSNTEEVVEKEIEKVQAICISNKTGLRTEPSKEGTWITSLKMGETMMFLGEKVIDTIDNNRGYMKVELSDGSIAWARSYGILVEATPAAIVERTNIFSRPELVAKSDKSFNVLEFIAIVSEKNDWVEVVGAGKAKKGWIKKVDLSTKEEDVMVATLAKGLLLDKNNEIIIEKIPDFLEDLPSKNTQFYGYLESLVVETAEIMEEIEESILEEVSTEE